MPISDAGGNVYAKHDQPATVDWLGDAAEECVSRTLSHVNGPDWDIDGDVAECEVFSYLAGKVRPLEARIAQLESAILWFRSQQGPNRCHENERELCVRAGFDPPEVLEYTVEEHVTGCSEHRKKSFGCDPVEARIAQQDERVRRLEEACKHYHTGCVATTAWLALGSDNEESRARLRACIIESRAAAESALKGGSDADQ